MPPRRPVSMVAIPSRSRLVILQPRNTLQMRSQSTSETPPPSSSRPSFSKVVNLASFAAEGELLTTARKGEPKPPQAPQTSPSIITPSKPLAYPRPKLKSNLYANNYTVSEAELDEPAEPNTISTVKEQETKPQPVSQTTAKVEAEATSRRRGRIKKIRTKKRPIQPLTDAEMTYKHITLSSNETVTVHDGYIMINSRHVKDGVITFGRLRDSCTCKLCRDPSTSQKSFTTGQAMREAYTGTTPIIEANEFQPATPTSTPLSSSSLESGSETGTTRKSDKSLKIIWRDKNGEKLHMSFFTRFKLRTLVDTHQENELHQPSISFSRKLWNAHEISQSDNLKISYEQVESKEPQVLLNLLEQVHKYGLVVIEGVPTNPTDDQNCYLRKVMGYIGEIRNTFYGETWDVKSMKQSKNVAYTNLDLGLHMDLLYFSSPPRFQSLHCLRNRVNGGMSYFVDSFKVAIDLDAKFFGTLQKTKLPYIYDNDNHFLRYSHRIISRQGLINDLQGSINWSPPFRDIKGSFIRNDNDNTHSNSGIWPPSSPSRAKYEKVVFDTISTFETALSDPKYRYSFTMKEGDLVMFDNRRVLHARTSFSDKSDQERKEQNIELIEGEPTRWLKGCYLDGEVVWDKLAVLRKQIDKEKKETRSSSGTGQGQ